MKTASEAGAKVGERQFSRIVFTEEEIARRVERLGREITEFYRESNGLLVLGLLKGSFVFLADLVRSIDLPLQVEFMIAASYGERMESSGSVELLYDPDTSMSGHDVLLVEDIVDSGTTMNEIIPTLKEREPESLEICALLHKRVTTLVEEPRWVGFDAPEEFLVGYGLDFSENFRHLPYIASL